MDFLSSGIGQYLAQTVLHSTIIAIIIESILVTWRIRTPSIQIRFRFLALLLPVLALPVFYLLYPVRSGSYFHQQIALFDFNQWFSLGIQNFTFGYLFLAFLVLTTAYFVLKEAIPSVLHYFRHPTSLVELQRGQLPQLDETLDEFDKGGKLPGLKILVSSETTPIVYTLRERVLVISVGTITMMDKDELETIIAHEFAHLTVKTSRLMLTSFILRALMFYNPVALLVFRHIVNDIERLCDDTAIALTGKRLALASGLLKMFRHTVAKSAPDRTTRHWVALSSRISILQDNAYRESARERADRVSHPDRFRDVHYQNGRLLVTAASLLVLLFFVV